MRMKRVCVFAGSRYGDVPAYRTGARELGRALARRGIELVYGGSGSGLMGEVADGALEKAGQSVIGVMPRGLFRNERAHPRLTQMIAVEDLHQRKATMARLSDAYIALPGGYGTLEELFETISWAQLGIHQKPVGLLNLAGYYDPLLELVDHAVRSGFIPPAQRELLLVESDPEHLLDRMEEHRCSPAERKWDSAGS